MTYITRNMAVQQQPSQIVILEHNGDMREFSPFAPGTSREDILKQCTSQCTNVRKLPTSICTYPWTEDTTIQLFGWNQSRSTRVNQHELPPPFDTQTYYYHIFACKVRDEHWTTAEDLLPLDVQEYQAFWENAFGGFESLGSQDSTTETEEETDSEMELEEEAYLE